MIVAWLTASFAHQEAVLDLNSLINALTHIVDRSGCDLRSDDGLHLTPCFVRYLNWTKYPNSSIFVTPLKGNFRVVKIYLVTEWNQMRRLFRCHYSCYFCLHLGVALLQLVLLQQVVSVFIKKNFTLSDCDSHSWYFSGNINHRSFEGFEVRWEKASDHY